ncbi:TDP-N-acetylfucosamine:lipid II N-acetylfucosaminyltransferase [Ulvibacterium sp.]|uniref:TDP-N-acetylfucosamine:lipid II N-acetylfucosaminyltransferase n=1 Tax=Ulvibacterium sp. TaxID=2665914 RepID=UPI002617D903|nr:TDP-N-acetylfucosamine:lipid II N-acetylfucosaminyltransferase [Ulvibacterium sp.]
MKKVIHIHSDIKFILDNERYLGDFFDNELIILDTKNSVNKEYHYKALFFEPSPENLNKIVAIVNTVDILVLYNLDFFKSQIVNCVDKRVKIIWRFFGTELYTRKLHLYLSPKSKPFMISKLIKGKIKYFFRFFFGKERMFYKAVRRSDIITGIFEEEYEYLKQHFSYLPKFIPLSLDNQIHCKKIDFDSEYPKKNCLVIGNSRSYYNNHLDILELAGTCNQHKKINITLLFNYGAEQAYTNEVRRKAAVLPQVDLIESFIPFNEFISFYGQIAAVVINSYRQLALGNIFLAFYKGVKVYLNKNNPTYLWLKKEGMFIYEVEDLKNDLETGQIYLAKKEILHNLNCMKNLEDSKTTLNFQSQIIQVLDK